MLKNTPFCGAVAAIVTPFEQDGSLDWFALDRVLDRAVALGYRAVALCGEFGEGDRLSLDEKIKIFESAALVTEHRARLILTVQAPAEAEEICACGRDISADGILFEHPLFGSGIYSFFERCARFSIPMAAIRGAGRGTLKVFPELFSIDTFDTIGERGRCFLETAELCDTVNRRVKGEIFCMDERLFPAMEALGAVGYLSKSALLRSVKETPSFPLCARLEEPDGVVYLKEQLALLGVCGRTVRLPM